MTIDLEVKEDIANNATYFVAKVPWTEVAKAFSCSSTASSYTTSILEALKEEIVKKAVEKFYPEIEAKFSALNIMEFLNYKVGDKLVEMLFKHLLEKGDKENGKKLDSGSREK